MADDTDRWFTQAVEATLAHLEARLAVERRREAFQHLRVSLTIPEISAEMERRLKDAGVKDPRGLGIGEEAIRKVTRNPHGQWQRRPK